MPKKWDLIDLLERGLNAEGFDGLYHEDGDCACETGNLAPCREPSPSCAAGYKTFECPERLDQDAEFYIVSELPAAREVE